MKPGPGKFSMPVLFLFISLSLGRNSGEDVLRREADPERRENGVNRTVEFDTLWVCNRLNVAVKMTFYYNEMDCAEVKRSDFTLWAKG